MAPDRSESSGEKQPARDQNASGPVKGKQTVSRYPCARCGAKLEFAPGTMSLVCRYCGQVNEIAGARPELVEELDYKTYAQARQDESAAEAVATIHCNTCAASVQQPAHITSLSCPYCGSNIVWTGASERLIKPNAVLPCVLTRERVITSFRAWLASRWFAPNALKKQGKLDAALTGLYVPHWTYDASTHSRYTGSRGDAYYVTVKTGKTTTQVRKVRWTRVSGVVDNKFDDLLVCASRSLTADQARGLEPWDLKAAVPYSDDYLPGMVAESYQITLPEGFEHARQIMQERIEAAVCADIGGDEQQIDNIDTAYSNITFKLLLAPVWITAYRYMNRVYNVLVNARTGEVIGQRPYSAWKITLFTIMCVIIAGVLLMIVLAMNNS
ncbi:MAG: primosomal protein N' (replication factor Y) - superfamily II helicase [bacterium]